jgi:hypothetical protein
MNDVVMDPNSGDVRHLVTASALGAPTERPRPKFLFFLVALTVGSSFYVVREPAPCDLLFVLLCVVAPFYRGVRISFDLSPFLTLSLVAFIMSNIISFWYASASLTINMAPVSGLFYMAVTFYLILYWYVISTLIRGYGIEMMETIKWAFVFAACAATVLGLAVQMGYLSTDSLGVRNSDQRVTASFKDPNVYAPFVSAAIILLFSDILNKSKIRLLELGLLGLLAVGIVGALSRGAFVNVLVSLAVLVFLQMAISLRARWLKRLFVMATLVAILGIPAVGFYLSDDGRGELFQQRLALQRYDDKRFTVQIETLHQLPQFPLGVGPGQSQQVLPQNPHNLYLMVTLENGLLGGIGLTFFFMACVWVCLSGVLQRGPYAHLYACYLAILAGTLVNSLVIDSLHWRHLFLFLALPIGLARLERAELPLARASSTAGIVPPLRSRPGRRAVPAVDHARSI